MEIKSLNCPNCSAPLTVEPGDTAIKCAHCGSDLRISSGGEASLFFRNQPGGSAQPETASAYPGLDIAEVRRLIAAEHKINAIKFVREKTGMGLKEAKDFVEALEAGTPPPIPAKSPPSGPIFSDPHGSGIDWERIRSELAHGRKIEAIKLYRAQTNVGLKEAKDAVEMFERGQIPPPPTAPPPPSIPGNVNLGEIRQLLATGKKLEAIKRYREQTNVGLKEALDIIEAMPESRDVLGGAGTGGGSGTGSGGGGSGIGCMRVLLGMALIVLLFMGGCGLYVQTTDEYACGMDLLTHNRDVIQQLGEPVETTPLAFVMGYSSSSDWGGNSSVGFGMYTLLSADVGTRWAYVEINHSSDFPYYLDANLFHNDERIRILDSISEADCNP